MKSVTGILTPNLEHVSPKRLLPILQATWFYNPAQHDMIPAFILKTLTLKIVFNKRAYPPIAPRAQTILMSLTDILVSSKQNKKNSFDVVCTVHHIAMC